jgi:Beta-galactosidase/beta-glucuronidase
MIRHIDLNDEWLYGKEFEPAMTEVLYNESTMEAVRLPHTNTLLPYHYFDEEQYQFVSCYRRHLTPEENWSGKRILLTFEGVAHVAKVYLNGELITTHMGGYTAFTVDLASFIKLAQDNVLVIEVDSTELSNIPPFGYVIDYLTYGGIYREVYLTIKEQISIDDVFITSMDTSHPENQKEVSLQVTFHGVEPEKKLKLKHSIKDAEGKVIYHNIESVSEEISTYKFKVSGVKNWEPEQPALYDTNLQLFDLTNGLERLLDEQTIRFGFRTCEFREDGFYLNHKRLKLIGLNRHQSYPYVGYAMPKRMQHRDAEILKYELQVNAVRTSHYPQSKHFINRCDELGLLVFTEIPGWQHIGDEQWKEVACENVKEMVLQYRNHPSIILWGVRINESVDDDTFYLKTNQIAHQLDHSRQTGGVRYLQKSNLLEDVYTYNDFLHNGTNKGIDREESVTSNKKAPYLVTEYNGHMFPTKAFDNEEHRLQHALRHACVLDAIFEQEKVSGGFGWCMFDYNTHKDFGSGDRICYHGVMDLFRNPKIAAAVYASQSERSDVLEISSSLDIGEHPAGDIGEVYAFTNADRVRLYKNNTFIKEFYPSKKRYPHLPHPPIVIDDFVGELLEKQENFSHKTAEQLKEVLFAVKKYGQNNLPLRYKLKMAYLMLKEHLDLDAGVQLYYKYIGSWGGAATTFRFDAIKDNEVVKVVSKKPAVHPRLSVTTKETTLMEEETYDVAEIRIAAVDEDGNRLPYFQEPVSFETWGAIELIGPSMISLKGGAAGTYVKTKGLKGTGGIRILQKDLGFTEISLEVR